MILLLEQFESVLHTGWVRSKQYIPGEKAKRKKKESGSGVGSGVMARLKGLVQFHMETHNNIIQCFSQQASVLPGNAPHPSLTP